MTTFLNLAKTVRQESGISGTGPSSVVGMVGMDKKVVDWTNDAWYDIQSIHPNWKWMWRDDGSINTVNAQRSYDISSFSVQQVSRDSFTIYPSGSPTMISPLTIVSYEEFREMVMGRPTQTGQPIVGAIDPAGLLRLDPVPNGVFVVSFEYYVIPSLMSVDSDVPDMPAKFHRLIVELALMKYCNHDESLEMYKDASFNYRKWLQRLESEQLPQMLMAGALA